MARRVINAEKEVQHIVDEIKHYFVKNGNENTKTIFTQKVASYMADTMQTISFLVEELEGLEN